MKNIILDDGRTAEDDFMDGGDGSVVNEEKNKIPEELVKQRDDAYREKNEQGKILKQMQEENERLKREIKERDYKRKCIEKGIELQKNGESIREELHSLLSNLEETGREELDFTEDLDRS
jgi:predicted ribosome quality control (RQC) complex YloA/Tae2 family protein